jgi:hypothetical protein
MTRRTGPLENLIVNQALVALSAEPETLVFRNNTGMAWQGKLLDLAVGDHFIVTPGMVVLAAARPVHFGLEGSGDIIGASVGKPLAVETKTTVGRQSKVQVAFGRAWTKAGGIYILARSADEAVQKTRTALLLG